MCACQQITPTLSICWTRICLNKSPPVGGLLINLDIYLLDGPLKIGACMQKQWQPTWPWGGSFISPRWVALKCIRPCVCEVIFLCYFHAVAGLIPFIFGLSERFQVRRFIFPVIGLHFIWSLSSKEAICARAWWMFGMALWSPRLIQLDLSNTRCRWSVLSCTIRKKFRNKTVFFFFVCVCEQAAHTKHLLLLTLWRTQAWQGVFVAVLVDCLAHLKFWWGQCWNISEKPRI